MCGIAGIYVKPGFIGKLPLEGLADMLMLGIEPRGRDATGYVAVNDGATEVALEKDNIPAKWFTLFREEFPENTQTVLMHTRWATQGPPEVNVNNHPVQVKSCYVTHNGHISNDDAVFNKLGVERPAEVDSVAIAAALSHYGMDDADSIVEGLTELSGGFAIAAIDPENNPGQLVLAKGPNNPMWVLNHRSCLIWASTKEAIEEAWGACIGTPPKKKFFSYPEDQRNGFFYDFFYGEYWIVNGNSIERARFEPYRSYTTSYSSWSSSGVVTNSNKPKGAKKYYCYPSKSNCDYACAQGCMTALCTCTYYDPYEDEDDVVPGCESDSAASCLTSFDEQAWGDSLEHGEDCIFAYLEPEVAGPDAECVCVTEEKKIEVVELEELNLDDVRSQVRSARIGDNQFKASARLVESDLPNAQMRCDCCWEWTKITALQECTYGGDVWTICPDCAESTEFIKRISVRSDARNRTSKDKESYTDLSDELKRLHDACVKEVANNMQTNPDFVEFLLFKWEPNDKSDGNLHEMRDLFEAEYVAVEEELKDRFKVVLH